MSSIYTTRKDKRMFVDKEDGVFYALELLARNEINGGISGKICNHDKDTKETMGRQQDPNDLFTRYCSNYIPQEIEKIEDENLENVFGLNLPKNPRVRDGFVDPESSLIFILKDKISVEVKKPNPNTEESLNAIPLESLHDTEEFNSEKKDLLINEKYEASNDGDVREGLHAESEKCDTHCEIFRGRSEGKASTEASYAISSSESNNAASSVIVQDLFHQHVNCILNNKDTSKWSKRKKKDRKEIQTESTKTSNSSVYRTPLAKETNCSKDSSAEYWDEKKNIDQTNTLIRSKHSLLEDKTEHIISRSQQTSNTQILKHTHSSKCVKCFLCSGRGIFSLPNSIASGLTDPLNSYARKCGEECALHDVEEKFPLKGRRKDYSRMTKVERTKELKRIYGNRLSQPPTSLPNSKNTRPEWVS